MPTPVADRCSLLGQNLLKLQDRTAAGDNRQATPGKIKVATPASGRPIRPRKLRPMPAMRSQIRAGEDRLKMHRLHPAIKVKVGQDRLKISKPPATRTRAGEDRRKIRKQRPAINLKVVGDKAPHLVAVLNRDSHSLPGSRPCLHNSRPLGALSRKQLPISRAIPVGAMRRPINF